MKKKLTLSPLAITAIYILVGFTWILVSDTLISHVASNLERLSYWQSIKGSVFVLATGLLIWWLIHRYAKEQKRDRDKLETALQEKEVLVREIHHRVKNNLAVISGLLEIQAFRISDERVQQVMEDSLMRIHSIAFVHERLYDSESFSRIANIEFIEKLIGKIRSRFNKGMTSEVQLEKYIRPFTLDVNQAIPVALLLNELITNAYNHAFPEGGAGHIRVEMSLQNKFVYLVVSDDGCGLPEQFSLDDDTNLGSVMISILTQQLEGDIQFSSQPGHGCRFELTFPRKVYRGSSSSLLPAG
ncbi:MAG TPA: sensor histidine kinase [Bacteroidales bacterium]|nr:sensor histidine kinase [Bacteroidales bacterium]